MLEQIQGGLWAYMPLLARSLQKLYGLIKRRLSQSGFEEVAIPLLRPVIWDEAIEEVQGILLKDQRLAIGGDCTGALGTVAGHTIQSHRDLPRYLFCLSKSFSDKPRPGLGLLDPREFDVIEAFTFDPSSDASERSYQGILEACSDVFTGIGLKHEVFDSDPGPAAKCSQSLVATNQYGDHLWLRCDRCGYKADAQWACSRLDQYPQDQQQLPMESVLGEGLISTEAIARFLGIPLWKTTKTMLFEADGRPVAVMVRGDCEVSLAKTRKALGCKRLQLLPAAQVRQLTGCDIGYLGPVGLPQEVLLIADHYVSGRVNFECGANRTNYHLINVNLGRDLPMPRLEDIRLAKPGDGCPRCDGRLEGQVGLEFVRLCRSVPIGEFSYVDATGNRQGIFIGRCTLNMTRVIGILAEQFHDQAGLCWPACIAPFLVHLIGLNLEDPQTCQSCQQVYQRLLGDNIDVLYDDRMLPAGQKFADSDLIGLPVRLTASKRSLAAGGLEYKPRSDKQSQIVDIDMAMALIKDLAARY
jgi:prolyl-tRNA synthetase